MKRFLAVLYFVFLLCACSNQNKNIKSYIQEKTVTVAGHILNHISSLKKITLVINRIGFHQESVETEIDSSGHFQFKFNSYIPTDAWLIYQTNFLVVTHPEDSIYVEFDGNSGDRIEILTTIKFSGDASNTNKEASEFQKRYFESGLFNWGELKDKANYEYERFKIFEDSLNAERDNFYNNYVHTTSPSREIEKWAKFFLDEAYFSDLTFYPDSHREALVIKQSKWSVPVFYYDFLKEKEFTEESLTSAAAISGFTDKYLYRYIRLHAMEIIKNGLEKKSFELNDSIIVQTLLGLTSSQLLRQIALTQFLNDALDESNVAGFEKLKSIADAIIQEPFLKEPLIRKYQQTKSGLAQLKLTPNAIDAENGFAGDPLLKIRKENAGRVIYLDIWATWCRPCREEFPYYLKLQKEFSKEVVFAFVCIDSEKSAYMNVLKKYQLKGQQYFLDKVESDQLRNTYKIEGIPHYALINKNGKIAFEGYTIKPSEDSTSAKIRSLL
jgi:thiol-disulfide isomerase/thioredoxin